MGHLNTDDRKLALELKRARILTDVEAPELNLDHGVIIVTCADGDQMPDLFSFQTRLFNIRGIHPRVHTLALNGGALLIPEKSPLNKENGEDRVLLAHLRDARKLKNIDTIVLYVHAPCGAAGLADLNFMQVMELLLEAKARIKKELPGALVACFCHVDWGENIKRTYFVSRDKWISWCKATDQTCEFEAS